MTKELPRRRYEVMARRDGRWLIDCLTPTEGSATARAEELIATDDRIEAVRVVRARFSITGESWETPIFERERDAQRRRPPIMVAPSPDDPTWCETIDDFYGADGRRAVARVLRNFLDRYKITPTELLHDPRYLRPLESQDGLIQSAVSRISQQQAAAQGVDTRARRDAIYGFVDQATRRAKAARDSGRMPVMDAGGLAGLAAAAAGRSADPAEQAFMIRFAASQKLAEVNGFIGRLEIVMGWAVPPLPPALAAYLDELVSGLAGAASFIQDLIGLQTQFGDALLAIAELAAGEHAGDALGAPPALAPLARLMANEAMPETRLVLIERLQRELASDKPLSRDAPMRQRQVFDQILDRLIDQRGLFRGGPAMVEALARRSRRLDIVGGIEPVRFASPDPVARLDQLLDLEKETLAERPVRALATCMVDILDHFEGNPAALSPIRRRVQASALPGDAKDAILSRLPHPS